MAASVRCILSKPTQPISPPASESPIPLMPESESERHQSHSPTQPRLFLLSGHDESSLRDRIQFLRAHLQAKGNDSGNQNEWLNNLAYTLNEHLPAQPCRAVLTANSVAQLIDRLSNQVRINNASKKPTVGFVFTGQGAEWPGMGKQLLQTYPVFQQSMERLERHMRNLGAPYSITDEILKPPETSRVNHPLLSQAIVTALQIALVNLLKSWEISPDAVAGHSSGEIAAAYAAGMIRMEDALTVAYFRGVTASKLLDSGIRGVMMASSSVTVSGDETAISELETMLEDKGVFTRRLEVGVAYHSHHMDRIAGEYFNSIKHIGHIVLPNLDIKFFSTVTGRQAFSTELDAQYWVQNIVGPVNMVEGLQSMCFKNNAVLLNGDLAGRKRQTILPREICIHRLIEIGPHAALAGPIKQTLKASNIPDRALPDYDSVLVRGMDATLSALAVASSLVCHGCSVNFQAINDPHACYEEQVLVDVLSESLDLIS